MEIQTQTDELQKKIAYEFKDSGLLRRALTHSSYSNERHLKRQTNNERLEFLGDAVLELMTSDFLFRKYPDMDEGKMTKLRASLVCEASLAICARDLELGKYLYLGRGEEVTGGRKRPSITSDAVEALIGAIYLDGGFASAKEFILKYVLSDMEKKQLFYDSKTILQEMIQKRRKEGSVSYEMIEASGPDHNKSFRVQVLLGTKAMGEGMGHSKKEAEQEAAYQAILKLKGQQRLL